MWWSPGKPSRVRPQNAAALYAVIKLGMNLGASLAASAAKNPQIAEVIQWLQASQLAANGSDVDLSLSIPEAQLESLVNSVPTAAKAVADARPTPPELHNGN